MNKKGNIKDNPQKKECTGNHRKDNSIAQGHGRKKVRLQERLIRIRPRLEIINVVKVNARSSCSPSPLEMASQKTPGTTPRTMKPCIRLRKSILRLNNGSLRFLGFLGERFMRSFTPSTELKTATLYRTKLTIPGFRGAASGNGTALYPNTAAAYGTYPSGTPSPRLLNAAAPSVFPQSITTE